MPISRDGKGKTLTIKLSVFPCGKCDTEKNLTISCSDPDTKFKTTLSEYGLKKFRDNVLKYYGIHVGKAK